MIKVWEMSNLSGDSLEKQVILYTSIHLEEAMICSDHKCSNDSDNKFIDDDMQ